MLGTPLFKIADRPSEFEAIHRWNYDTLVEEIPQRPPNEVGRLVDRIHDESTYAIRLEGEALMGMIAGRCATAAQRLLGASGRRPDKPGGAA